MTHLFFLCEKTEFFYKDLSKFIENKIKFKIPLDILTVIMGYLIHNQHFEAVITLFLVAKKQRNIFSVVFILVFYPTFLNLNIIFNQFSMNSKCF